MKLGNCTRIYSFSNRKIKLVTLKLYNSAKSIHHVKNTVNDSKLDNNISRAHSKVYELIMCNEWDWWCTFTINPDKYDRYNLKAYYSDFSRFINNYNKNVPENFKVRYLFVPEQHKDGAWHMHGLIRGIKPDDLRINQYGYMTWVKYEQKFGFISMSAIKNLEATANYTKKYMTKDKMRNVTSLGQHMYYSSKGLNKAQVVFTGFARLSADYDYENDYCKVKWYSKDDQGIQKYLTEVKLFKNFDI